MSMKQMRGIIGWLLFGGVLFFLLTLLWQLGGAVGAARYRILADSAVLPAVLLLAIGAALALSRGGLFDIFLYSFSRLSLIFAPLPRGEVSYYDFKERRHRQARDEWAYLPLLAGAFYLFLSLVFTLMFYRA